MDDVAGLTMLDEEHAGARVWLDWFTRLPFRVVTYPLSWKEGGVLGSWCADRHGSRSRLAVDEAPSRYDEAYASCAVPTMGPLPRCAIVDPPPAPAPLPLVPPGLDGMLADVEGGWYALVGAHPPTVCVAGRLECGLPR